MLCIIPGPNLKVFAKGLHALAKIGEDLYMEPQKDGLALRTMNSSRSAFASFLFNPAFFTSYDFLSDNGSYEDARCRITMKSTVWVFKSVANLEKTVNFVTIQICPDDNEVKIQFQCKYNVLKKFTINFLECESLKANADRSDCTNHLTASAKILNEAALNFLSNQEEVTMQASDVNFQMRNFVDVDVLNNELDRKSIVHTNLTMQRSEFVLYDVQNPSSVTYCLKELRALIGFADTLNLDVTVDFDVGGKPIVFSLNWPQTCEAALIMATLAEVPDGEDDPKSDQRQSSQVQARASPVPNGDQLKTQNQRRSTQKSNAGELPNTPGLTPILKPQHEEEEEDQYHTGAEEVVNSSRLVLGGNGDAHDTPPPSKRAKYIFQKCFNATFNPKNVEGAQKVLAPDSDEEDATM